MSAQALLCDQAIFTSVRTPMGEGYRIIAASRGLSPEQRQAITRHSPSHDALCRPRDTTGSDEQVQGMAFYPLPNGRLCVAFSRHAGTEHTGRGGYRVYTHNLVFDESHFPVCSYNPFAVLRAMAEAQLTSPQLEPPAVLPELELRLSKTALAIPRATLDGVLGPAWRGYVLDALLGDRRLIVNAAAGWLEVAEALLMGIPGPLRQATSLCAGLRFSVGRCHSLTLLYDEKNTTRTRTAGQRVEYLDPASTPLPPGSSSSTTPGRAGPSEWLSFVERHWTVGDTPRLARRTSRPFSDADGPGRERIGRLYNTIDAIDRAENDTILETVAGHLSEPSCAVEAELGAELALEAQRVLLQRLNQMSWDGASRLYRTVCDTCRKSSKGRLFAEPLVERALHLASAVHPSVAAGAVLEFLRNAPSGGDQTELSCLNTVLTRFADWAQQAPDDQLEMIRSLCQQWRAVRPQCPILDRVQQRCKTAAIPS